jgi:site-specific DNA recombinase
MIAIDRFTRLMRELLVSGDVTACEAYLARMVDAIIVSEGKVSEGKIRILGSNDSIRPTFGPKANLRPGFVNLFRNGAPGRNRTSTPCGTRF